MGWIRLPDRMLPAPETAELPPPVPLRYMLGPSIVLAGLSLGSGEFVLWPRLTAEWGFSLFWACVAGVTLQFFVNMEIERYTLATGESAVTGFVRLWRGFGPLFLVAATLPWIWPGWATGAATLLSWEIGGPVRVYAVAGLVACGLALSTGAVVYRTVERLQTLLVGAIFAGVVLLAALVVRAEDVAALGAGLLQVGHVPDGIHLPLLLSALAFAGAGGSANLAQSNLVKDKGYAMGAWIGRLTSPFTGRVEAESEVGRVFEASPVHAARWRAWWRRANVEHGVSFLALCLVSMALLCLVTHALLGAGGPVGPDLEFLGDEARVLEERLGPGARHLFLIAGIAVLFSTELGLLDAVSRVAADLIKLSFLRGRPAWTISRLYFVVLWSLIAFGALVLATGFDQPLQLLVLSASLNAFVMFGYTGLLLWLNARSFGGPLRPGALRLGALGLAFAFFGYFSALTLAEQVRRVTAG